MSVIIFGVLFCWNVEAIISLILHVKDTLFSIMETVLKGVRGIMCKMSR